MVRKVQEEYDMAGLTINMKKSEYITVGNDCQQDLQLDDKKDIKGVATCEFLGLILNKKENTSNEIKERVKKVRKIIQSLNLILWDKTVIKKIKKIICKSAKV